MLVGRLTSVFGPGQVAWEGATGAIASFAARALAGEPIVIAGDPERTRDFLYVDDAIGATEALVAEGRSARDVLYRLFSYWLPLPSGLLASILFRRRHKERVTAFILLRLISIFCSGARRRSR